MKKTILGFILGVTLAIAFPVLAASVLFPYQGGTGVGDVPTDGQLLIGQTDGTYNVNTLTAGSNITITEGDGTITITGAAGGGGGSGNLLYNTTKNLYNVNTTTGEWVIGASATSTNAKLEVQGDVFINGNASTTGYFAIGTTNPFPTTVGAGDLLVGDDATITNSFYAGDIASGNNVLAINSLFGAFLESRFVGAIDMRGDPWFLSGTDFQISQNLDVDSDLNVDGNSTTSGNLSGKVFRMTPDIEQSITAAGNTITSAASHVELSPNADYVMTGTPTIEPGSDGQILLLHNLADIGHFDIDLQDNEVLVGSDVFLGGADSVIKPSSTMMLHYSIVNGGGWYVISNPNSSVAGANADVQDVRNATGSAIPAGSAVKITGWNVGQGRGTIVLADADTVGLFPADGFTATAIADGANGEIITFGYASNIIDTSGQTIGNGVYLSTTPGEVVFARPSIDCVQKMGTVIRVNANNGVVDVTGAGRCNDVPWNAEFTTATSTKLIVSTTAPPNELSVGDLFIGNNATVTNHFEADATLYVKDGRVGIGTDSPNSDSKLHVTGGGYFGDQAFPGTANLYLSVNGAAIFRTNSVNSGNPEQRFMIDGSTKWVMGVARADSNKFKILGNTSLTGTKGIIIDISGKVGIGTDSPGQLFTVGSGDLFTVDSTGNASTTGYFNVGVSNNGLTLGAGDLFVGGNATITNHFEADTTLYVKDSKVGIGTDSPAKLLDLKGDTPTIRFEDTTGGMEFGTIEYESVSGLDRFKLFPKGGTFPGLFIQQENVIGTDDMLFLVHSNQVNNANFIFEHFKGEDFYIQTRSSNTGDGDIIFRTNAPASGTGNERMIIKVGGNIGLGTISPAQKLEVIGNASTTGWFSIGSGLTAVPATFGAGDLFVGANATVTTNLFVGTMIFGDVTGDLTGNADTATALAVNPTTCTNQFVRDLDADGTLTCATVDAASINQTDSFTWSGTSHLFAGVTNFTIPAVANATGEIAIDPTTDTLRIYGSAERVLDYQREFSFTIASTTFDLFKKIPIKAFKKAITITDIYCFVIDGTDQDIFISDGTNDFETIACDVDGQEDDGSLVNNTFNAREFMYVEIGTKAGLPDFLNVTITYTIDSD